MKFKKYTKIVFLIFLFFVCLFQKTASADRVMNESNDGAFAIYTALCDEGNSVIIKILGDTMFWQNPTCSTVKEGQFSAIDFELAIRKACECGREENAALKK